jgi:hypothetical protein
MGISELWEARELIGNVYQLFMLKIFIIILMELEEIHI